MVSNDLSLSLNRTAHTTRTILDYVYSAIFERKQFSELNTTKKANYDTAHTIDVFCFFKESRWPSNLPNLAKMSNIHIIHQI